MKKSAFYLILMILSSITISAQDNELSRKQLVLDWVEQFRTAIVQNNKEFIDAIIEDPIIYKDWEMISKSDIISLYEKFWTSGKISCRFDEIEVAGPSKKDMFEVILKYKLSNDSNMLSGHMRFLLDLKKEIPKIPVIYLSSNDTSKEECYHRLTMLSFCENLRIAYDSKDFDFINKTLEKRFIYGDGRIYVFSDDMSFGQHPNQILENYRKSLERIFQKNQKVDYHIKDIEILSHPIFDGVFGLSFEQKWTCGSYHDENYYFSLWDFRMKDKPTVHFSVIQPTNTPKDKKIGVGDFDDLEFIDE